MNGNKIQSINFNNKNIKQPKKVAILYSDVKREYFPTESQYITEEDARKDAEIIAIHIRNFNIKVDILPGNSKLPHRLKESKPNIVFNLVDSVKGSEYLSSTIPSLLELLDIPYTGTGILGKALDTNKFLIKKLLQQNGIPIPDYQLFNTPNDPIDTSLRFPLISKLNEIHGNVEITENAVSENEKHLRDRLRYLINTYKQPVLVEEYIVGKEVAAILLEGLNKKVYIGEKKFLRPSSTKFTFTTFEDMWLKEGIKNIFSYQKYIDPILKEYVKKAFEVTKMADYGKFDIRIDSAGRYYFIDTNCNPSFGPIELECAMAYVMDLYGIKFKDILERLIINTISDNKTDIPETKQQTKI